MKHLSDDQIQAFADNQLLAEEMSVVQSHINLCAHCRQEISLYKTLYQQLENEAGFELTPEFSPSTMKIIEQKSAGNLQEKLFTLFLVFAGIVAVLTTSFYFVDFQTIWTDMKIDSPTFNTQSIKEWTRIIKTFIPKVNFNYDIIVLGGLVMFSLAVLDRLVLQARFKIAAK